MMKITGRKPIDKSKINRILIRATNWVGDVVMTIPALEAVKENFPASTLTVLARPSVIPLFANHPAVNQVLPIRKGRGQLTDLVEIIRVARMIRRYKFDLAILFQNAFEAALLTFLGGIRFRVGYNTDGRRFLLSHAVIRNDKVLKVHQVEYYLSLLKAMGWRAKSKDSRLFIAEKDMETMRSLLLSKGIGEDDFLLGLSPGAVFGPAKRWPAERFAFTGDRAGKKWGAKIVVLGNEDEKEIGMEICTLMKHAPLNLCGMTTIGEAMALIKRCSFFVTNDSGLMHVADALSVPMVAIFGSTDPVITGPRSKKARIVKHRIDCSPCLKPECHVGYRCMLDIEPEEVWKDMEILKEKLQ